MKTMPSTASAAPPRAQWIAAIQASSRKNGYVGTRTSAADVEQPERPAHVSASHRFCAWGAIAQAYCANSAQIAADTNTPRIKGDRA